jgi:hypothetical protein
MEEPKPSPGSQEISPVERGARTNEVPMPQQKTGDVPPSPDTVSRDNQKSGRDTEEAGKWQAETR